MGSKTRDIQRHKSTTSTDSKELHLLKHYHQGPIPAPDDLMKYEALCPGLADRIVKMAESQIAHRQSLEQISVTANAELAKLGIFSAVIISVAVIIAGAYIVSCGQSLEGLAAIVGALVSLVGVFIYGKESNKKELREKQKIMDNLSR